MTDLSQTVPFTEKDLAAFCAEFGLTAEFENMSADGDAEKQYGCGGIRFFNKNGMRTVVFSSYPKTGDHSRRIGSFYGSDNYYARQKLIEFRRIEKIDAAGMYQSSNPPRKRAEVLDDALTLVVRHYGKMKLSLARTVEVPYAESVSELMLKLAAEGVRTTRRKKHRRQVGGPEA